MTPRGRLQLILWKVRLQLRKSDLLRSLVRRARALVPDSRDRHLKGEVRFWRRWLQTGGLSWPEDFAFRFDPNAPLQEHLARLAESHFGRQERISILDVGAGPVTVVGKRYPGKALSITATDALADDYNALLDEFGLTPPVRTIRAEAERLVERLGERSFDIVHAQNSLDHCADPVAALDQMMALTRPGGLIVLLHEENEGINELYHALHKWDFTCSEGRFVIAGPGPGGPRTDISARLEGRAEVECTVQAGEVLAVIRKLEDEPCGT